MTEKIIAQFEKLVKQKDVINARLASVKAKIKEAERKKDTRKKILIGAMVLNELKNKPKDKDLKLWLNKNMDNFLTRDDDRNLFDLKPH